MIVQKTVEQQDRGQPAQRSKGLLSQTTKRLKSRLTEISKYFGEALQQEDQ